MAALPTADSFHSSGERAGMRGRRRRRRRGFIYN